MRRHITLELPRCGRRRGRGARRAFRAGRTRPLKAGTLTGEGALLASLSSRKRTGKMTDIVATIQAEQDRIIRADLNQGSWWCRAGPGTGKTAVALHRAAYLLYTHRRSIGAFRRAGDRPELDVPALHRPGAPLAAARRASSAAPSPTSSRASRRPRRDDAARRQAQGRPSHGARSWPTPWRAARTGSVRTCRPMRVNGFACPHAATPMSGQAIDRGEAHAPAAQQGAGDLRARAC